MSYQELSKILKILANPSRLEILDMLSGGELYVCDLLEHFRFPQPTRSDHMKTLVESEWFYTGHIRMHQLNHALLEAINQNLCRINTAHERCICHAMMSGVCGA
ncbi:ArsR/SmtB family transcription factor [Staphylococcus intermedius]|uniref:ArsR/SmtB family transcription factor n=1 Tax=Staphylococcus intermedius TaxID=1285 RepID=UPI000BBB77AC|nr:metalloregulator ArsR/SmtB family transcription factor [Staphylococcus intermedius]PCF87849.1 transcriptional regulator [Staphylococcus intermedius]